jgi:hypothetical protein
METILFMLWGPFRNLKRQKDLRVVFVHRAGGAKAHAEDDGNVSRGFACTFQYLCLLFKYTRFYVLFSSYTYFFYVCTQKAFLGSAICGVGAAIAMLPS